MYYVQILVVDENGNSQNDADVTEFNTLEEAFSAQARANETAQEAEPDRLL
jgi:hypothetical protein